MRTYSTYEAKAKLSEILRKVRRGATVEVTHRGKVVAEIRPKQRSNGLEERIEALTDRGAVAPQKEGAPRFEPVVARPGALERFLASRDE